VIRDAAEGRQRVLDPVERLSEILFGLIMVLTFTCSISVAEAGREEVRSVLIGAIGCNLAWGLVDAVMYLMAIVIQRGRSLAVVRAVRAAQQPEQGRKLIEDHLPDRLGELFDGAALETARQKLVALPSLEERPKHTQREWRGALGVFLLVFLSTFPVVVPFLLFAQLPLAMRVSNGVAIVMLYITGYSLARYAGLRPVRTGLVMVAIGVVLVLVTIALGG
jgi:hypothetical protein